MIACKCAFKVRFEIDCGYVYFNNVVDDTKDTFCGGRSDCLECAAIENFDHLANGIYECVCHAEVERSFEGEYDGESYIDGIKPIA